MKKLGKTERLIGTNKPIIVEFTYEEWRRLSKLSNKNDQWILKFYNAILDKAGLKTLNELSATGFKLDVSSVVVAKGAAKKYKNILEKKYTHEYSRSMLSLDVGPSEYVADDDPKVTPDQIIIRPEACGLTIWSTDVFKK